MELSHSLLDSILKATFEMSRPLEKPPEHVYSPTDSPWESSPVNPKNRIDSLSPGTNSKWRVDGATVCGTQFYVVPTCLLPNLVPLRIDLFTPDQADHPKELRKALQSSFSVVMRDPSLARLGICRHLCRALDYHSDIIPGFWGNYQALPFGSKLVFENITGDVKNMTLSIVPAYDLEKKSLSVVSLQRLWEGEVPRENWPEIIDLNRLRLTRQIHDSISLVYIAEHHRESINEDFIFKSNTNDFKFIYHELLFLLRTPPHANLMTSPKYVVTKTSCFGGKRFVCGFILPYYPLGSIRDALPFRTLHGTLAIKHQLKWSRQVTSALIHIQEYGKTFYSDLRPDNVLLSAALPSISQPSDDCEDAVLIDFEQRGNWHEWCAPEILYRSYLEQVRLCLHSPSSSSPEVLRWQNLVHFPPEHTSPGISSDSSHLHHEKKSGSYHPDTYGQSTNVPWFSLPSACAQEAAQVYSLGLFIYCVFEGLSNCRISVANAYPCEPDVEFPLFTQRTPEDVRILIRKCTVGAREWERAERHVPRVVRIGKRLFPEGKIVSCLNGSEEHETENIWDTATLWWKNELARTESFMHHAQERLDRYVRERPTLREVLIMLEQAGAVARQHR